MQKDKRINGKMCFRRTLQKESEKMCFKEKHIGKKMFFWVFFFFVTQCKRTNFLMKRRKGNPAVCICFPESAPPRWLFVSHARYTRFSFTMRTHKRFKRKTHKRLKRKTHKRLKRKTHKRFNVAQPKTYK